LQIAIIRSVRSNCGHVVISSENILKVQAELDKLPPHYHSKVILHERPEKLAKDPATITDVLVDFIKNFSGEVPDEVAVVLPTSPFNSAGNIIEAFNIFQSSSCDKLLSVSKSDKPPFNAWVYDKDLNKGVIKLAFPDNPYKLTQSTSCPETYFSNGCISIYNVKSLVSGSKFIFSHSSMGFYN